jgi:K319-like protein
MKKTIALTILLGLALSAPAMAEHGDWEYLVGGGGGMSSLFMGVSPVSETTIFTVGMSLFGESGFQYAWKSLNGGQSFSPIMVKQIDATNLCAMMDAMLMPLAMDFADANTGVAVGMGMNPDCMTNCQLIQCMTDMGPKFWLTQNGGNTWDESVDVTNVGAALNVVQMLDANTGIAAGGPAALLKTSDGGDTWTDLDTSGSLGTETVVNDMSWLSETIGFMASGRFESEAKSSSDPMAIFDARIRFLTDFGYRFSRGLDKDSKAFNHDGGIWKSSDSGESWTRQFQDYAQTVTKISFFDEMNGIVMTDGEQNPNGPQSIVLYTHDGGETWEQAVLPEMTDFPPQGSAKYFLSDVHMIGKKLCYAVGAGDALFGALAYSLILYSEDGGETWVKDTSLTDWQDGLLASGWLNGRHGWGVGTDLECDKYTADNFGPVADAGQDQAVSAGTATLDGSGSYDDNGDPLTYSWTQVDGPTVTLSDISAMQPDFDLTESGAYTFELTVSDGTLTDSDQVTLTKDAGDDDDDDDDAVQDDDDDSGSDDDDDDDEEDDGGCCG